MRILLRRERTTRTALPQANRIWPSSTIEAARNRPNKPANATANEGTGALVSELRKMSKMERHDIKSISAAQLWSFQEKAGSDQAGSAAGSLGAQLQKSQELNEYCDRAVAEIRASLARSQNEGH
jgi:hypothetical protein